MKKLIKKIIREEIDDFDWIRDNSISGDQLRDLILQTGATSIPFDRVGGNLNLYDTPIKSLGNLKSVGGGLNLYDTSVESLGNLESVGGYLYLTGTPLAKKYSEAEIRQMVQVDGNIYKK